MHRRRRQEKTGYGLLWALLASVAIHMLLALLSWFVPIGIRAARPVPEESRITFTFAPQGERDLTGNAPSASQPTPREIIPVPPGDRPAPFVAPPEATVPPLDEALPPALEEPTEPHGSEEQPSAAAETEFPEAASDPFRSGPSESEPAETPPRDEPEPSLDINRALSDFHRALVRAQRSRPADSGRDGGVVFVPRDISALPTTGYGVGNLEFSSRDYDWSDYGRQIYIAIWRAWHNRLHATTDEFERWAFRNQNWLLDHVNRIVFTIESNGEVTGIAIETPSGCIPLDDSATTALEEVVLPPLPADFPRDQETVRAMFIAFGDIRTMRRVLEYRKRSGHF